MEWCGTEDNMTYEFTIITIIIPLYQGYSWDIPSLFCRWTHLT